MIGDFVKADLPYFDVCISNTPYQVRPSPLPTLSLLLKPPRESEDGRKEELLSSNIPSD